jgi:hypothetical protein
MLVNARTNFTIFSLLCHSRFAVYWRNEDNAMWWDETLFPDATYRQFYAQLEEKLFVVRVLFHV